MVNRKFEKYFRHVAYSYDEILSQVHKLQERYEVVTYKSQKDSFVVYIRLRPTNEIYCKSLLQSGSIKS